MKEGEGMGEHTEDTATGDINMTREGMADLLTQYSLDFDRMVGERHEMGQEKYGPIQFLAVDTIEEALQEIADLANYARYTFIKLRLTQAAIAGTLPEADVNINFVSSSDASSVREKKE